VDLGLQGKRGIVTGGGRGIGKAMARELACEGVDLAIVSRSREQLQETTQELQKETGRRIIPLVADVTSKEQVDSMVAQAAEQLGITPEEVERQDFAAGSPRGNAIGRMVDAEEIAYLTVFLASDKAWAVTGEVVVANGGTGSAVYY
jgi:NAD(P)-dependent dehydrogenase (short-subunit alcohol dehydrogenase family)